MFGRIFAPKVLFRSQGNGSFKVEIEVGFWNITDGIRKPDAHKFKSQGFCTFSLHDTDVSLKDKIVYNFIPIQIKESDRHFTPNYASLRTFIYYFCQGKPPSTVQYQEISDALLYFMNYFKNDLFEHVNYIEPNITIGLPFDYSKTKRLIRRLQVEWYDAFSKLEISMMDIGRAAFLLHHREKVERFFFDFDGMLWDRMLGLTPLDNVCNHPSRILSFSTSEGNYSLSEMMLLCPHMKEVCLRRLTANKYDLRGVAAITFLRDLISHEEPECFNGKCNHDANDNILCAFVSTDLKALLSYDHKGSVVNFSHDYGEPYSEILITRSDKSSVVTEDSIPRQIIGQYYDCWFLAINGIACNTCDYTGFTFDDMRNCLIANWPKIAIKHGLNPNEKIVILGNLLRQWEPPHVMFVLDSRFDFTFICNNKRINITLPSCASVFLTSACNFLLQFARANNVKWRAACINPFQLGTYDMISSLSGKYPWMVALYLLIRTIVSRLSVSTDLFSNIIFKSDSKRVLYSMESILKQLPQLRFDINNIIYDIASYGRDRIIVDAKVFETLSDAQKCYVSQLPYEIHSIKKVFTPRTGSFYNMILHYNIQDDLFFSRMF